MGRRAMAARSLGMGALVLCATASCAAQCVPTWSTIKRGTHWRSEFILELDASLSGIGMPTVLYGGGFFQFGGAFPENLAQFDGQRIHELGGGVREENPLSPVLAVKALLVHPPSQSGFPPGLYVGGYFHSANGLPVHSIARWDGHKWHDVGGGVGWPSSPNGFPQVMALGCYGSTTAKGASDRLFVGGSYESAGTVSVDGLAAWDGTNWSVVGGGLGNAPGTRPWVGTLTLHDDDGAGPRPTALYAGGNFLTAGGKTVNHVARWDGTTWEPLAQGMASTPVMSLCEFDEDGPGPGRPALFAGGGFKITGNPDIWYIARWDGHQWSSVGPIFNGPVMAMTVFDDDGPGPNKPSLFAGGTFTHIFTTPYSRIARWDGSAWYPLESGVYGYVTGVDALGVFDEDGPGPNPGGLYVGGTFYFAGGHYSHHAARWGCPLPVQPCDPDCNSDGAVNLSDFNCFLTNMTYSTPYADEDENFLFSPADLFEFQSRFAAGCP